MFADLHSAAVLGRAKLPAMYLRIQYTSQCTSRILLILPPDFLFTASAGKRLSISLRDPPLGRPVADRGEGLMSIEDSNQTMQWLHGMSHR